MQQTMCSADLMLSDQGVAQEGLMGVLLGEQTPYLEAQGQHHTHAECHLSSVQLSLHQSYFARAGCQQHTQLS